SDRGRGLDFARPPSSGRRPRLFPARLFSLRPRRLGLPEAALPRDNRKKSSVRSFGLLLPGLSKVAGLAVSRRRPPVIDKGRLGSYLLRQPISAARKRAFGASFRAFCCGRRS